MIEILDAVLDHITSYRLVLYYLIALLAAAFLLSFFGLVPTGPTDLAFSAVVILGSCWVANWVFSRVFDIPANTESVYITALILTLILDPVGGSDIRGVGILIFAGIWAMAGKFMLAFQRKHIFNPAALAVVLTGYFLGTPASWWVGGNMTLLPVVLIGGLLLVRKLRRFDLVATFVLAVAITTLVTTPLSQFGDVLLETAKSSPLLFFAFVMLTEPLTAPTVRVPRLLFAALVGALFAPSLHFGAFYLTPELALIIGNLFAWVVSPKTRFALKLERIEQAATDTYDFIFSSPRRIAFRAGQYLEWTLDVPHPDNRGNRRYFTLASAPTEGEVRLGVKFYPEASAFKRALGAMEPGDTIYAAQIAGNFTLPADKKRKLAFVAGGIGITPFRSMLQDLLDRQESRPIVVLYGNERRADIAYSEVLDDAERLLGIQTHYAIRQDPLPGQHSGFIDAAMVQEAVPDWAERTFYISGPQAMVEALRSMLLGLGVHRSDIKVDFFPGFA